MQKDCIFCNIAEGKLPSGIVYKSNNIVAFRDTNPQAPVHMLIIPKKHISKISDLNEEDAQLVGEMVLVANELVKENNLTEDGYRLVFNCGEKAGQAVFHIHLHLLGGRDFNWPPG